MPTRDQRDRNEMYLSVIRRQMSLQLSINYFPPPRQVRVMIVAFCLYKYFPFGGLQRVLCVLLRQLPPEVIMFGFIPVVGRRMP